MSFTFQLYRIKKLEDSQVVEGIQQGSDKMLDYFYNQCSNYFYHNYKGVVANFDSFSNERAKDKNDLFAESFEHLWSEIENKRIFARNGEVFRINKEGTPQKLVSSLTTFLMSIAKKKGYEQNRENWIDDLDDFTTIPIVDSSLQKIVEMTEKEIKIQIIDDCLGKLHKRCKDILTMFYVAQMSLDEILYERRENMSKDGLKTSKYKCLNTLRESVKMECKKREITI